MKTKFIGLDGFGEIEALKTSRKIKKHYVKRTIRFAKKTVQMTYCLAKSFEKPKRKVEQATPTLDACYKNARMGKKNEFSVKVFDFAHYERKQLKKKAYSVRYTRDYQPISNGFIKHKAALGTLTASIAVVFAALTIFGTMGVSAFGNNDAVATDLLQPLSYNQNDDNQMMVGTATEDSVSPANAEMYNNIALAVAGENSNIKPAGLYVDGKFMGAVTDETALYEELDNLLAEYMEGYDDTTSTEYVSNVEVKAGEYEVTDIMTPEELVNKASEVLQIALTTDVSFERELAYESEVEYDDSKDATYEEVTQEGKPGVEKVTYKATFVNGIQTDSVETKTEVIKKAVSEVVVKGTQEATTSSESNSSSSSQTGGSSTGSFIWPVPNTHNVTSGYGYRWGTLHSGIDISNGVTGETIVASDGGTVTWAGYDDSGYGNYVVIDHGNGYQTLYGHCSSVYVSAGEYVSQGQSIAGMGSTGDSTGTHLHFEIRLGSSRLDPSGFVS